MGIFSDEIESRKGSNNWSKDIAVRVVKEHSRRKRRKLTVAGSIFVSLMIAISIGINVFKTSISEDSWENYLMTGIYESVETEAFPQEVDEFIKYSFNGN